MVQCTDDASLPYVPIPIILNLQDYQVCLCFELCGLLSAPFGGMPGTLAIDSTGQTFIRTPLAFQDCTIATVEPPEERER